MDRQMASWKRVITKDQFQTKFRFQNNECTKQFSNVTAVNKE